MNISSIITFKTRDRLVLDLRPLGIPEIPMLGRYHFSHAHMGLTEHAHPGTIEICFLAKGTQLYRMGRSDYVLRGGDIFVAFPDEQHSTGEAPQEKGLLYWLQITLTRRSSPFFNCAPADARKLAAQLMATMGFAERGLNACSAHARRSFPVPLSPSNNTVA